MVRIISLAILCLLNLNSSELQANAVVLRAHGDDKKDEKKVVDSVEAKE